VSPDGLLAADSWSPEEAVTLIDTRTGESVGTLRGHRGAITRIAFSPDGSRLLTASRDTTALVWDLTPFRAKLRAGSAVPAATDLDSAWDALGGEDGPKTQRAVWSLAAAGDRAVDFLKRRLSPAAPVEPERISRLLVELDSEEFARREQATKELKQLDYRAETALLEALEGKPAAEAERRARAILAALDNRPAMPPERLRVLRALEVLEKIDNEAARKHLTSLAEGAPDAWLTTEARACLRRLAGMNAGR
jgi:hypothetical protein